MGANNPLAAAIGQYLARLREQPTDRDAYQTLEKLCVQTGDWGKLAEAAELLGDGVSSPRERLTAYLRAGAAHEYKLGDDQAAIRCFAKALGLYPGDSESLNGFLRILAKHGQWGSALSAMGSAIESVNDPKRRAELLLESAKLRAERLDDVSGALSDLQRALQEDVATPNFRSAAETTLGEKGAFNELAQLWRSLAETTKDPVIRAGALMDAAALYRDKLSRPAEAALAMETCAAGQPPGSKMMSDALALYRQAARWNDVLRLLERERAITTDLARLKEILVELAKIHAGPLGDPAAAADTWLNVVKVFPEDADARGQAMAELTRAGRWEDLAQIQSRNLDRELDPIKWRENALGLAKLYEERLTSPERAMKIYEEMSRKDPADVEIVEALTRVYEARGRWAELAATCERAAGLLGPIVGVTYLHHAASLFEYRLSQPEKAIGIFEKLIEDDPNDEFAANALVRLNRESGTPAALADALAAVAKITSDPAVKRDVHAERAALLAGPLRDPQAAVDAWNAALELDAKWLSGLHGLQDAMRKLVAYRRRDANASELGDLQYQLIDVLDRELSLVEPPNRKAEIHREAAALYEARNLIEPAMERYEEARKVDPEDLDALEHLLRLYRDASMRREEAQALRDLARLRRGPRERGEAAYTLGVLLLKASQIGSLKDVATTQEIGEPEPWVPWWRRAVAEDASHRQALAGLVDHAENKKDWTGAVELLAQQAGATHEPNHRAVLLTRAGDHLRIHVADEDAACAKYNAALALSQRHVPAARPLADALFRRKKWSELEPLQRRFGADLALKPGPAGVADAFWRSGTCVLELGREADAVTQWTRAVEADATYLPALEDLAKLLRKMAEWRSARDIYTKILYLDVDSAKQQEVQRALAVIAEALDEPEEAVDRYKKVVQIDAGDIDALQALARLYVSSARWKDALEVYEHLLPYTGDPRHAADIYVRRGEILAERLDDPAKAVDAYAAALAARPNVETRFRLADAFARCGRWREAAAERVKLAEEEPDVKARIEHYVVLAEILLTRLRDEAGAREAYENALELDPVEKRSLLAVTTLYEKGQLWEPLVRVLRVSAEQLDPRRFAVVSDLRTRIASILADKIDNVTEAVGELRLALKASPDHQEALARMADLAPTDPAFDREALAAHHRLIARDPLRIDSLRVLGEIYARQKRGERARLFADLLALLKSPHEQLSFIASSVRKKMPLAPERPLAPEDISGRVPYPGERGAILKMMRVLESAAERLYPPSLEEKGATAQDRVDPAKVSRDALPGIAFAFATALGIEKLTVYRARASTVEVIVETTSKGPVLLLGPRVLAEPPRDASHQVAKALWHVANGLSLMAKLKPEIYDRLVLATIASFLEGNDAKILAKKAGAKEGDLALTRRALPRKKATEIRPLASEAADLLGEDPRGSVKQWRMCAQLSADRAALLLTGDIGGSVRRAIGGGQPAEIAAREPARVAEIVRGSPEAFEMLRFASSEDFLALREVMGFF